MSLSYSITKSLRIVVDRSSPGKEFHTLAPTKDLDFKLKVVVFLRGMMGLLVPLKFFALFPTTNRSLIYSGNMPFTALKINVTMSCSRRVDKVKS